MKISTLKNVDNGQRVALLSGTIAVIDTAKAVVPSVLVQGILSTVSNILAIAKNTLQNEGDFRGLIEQCRVICDIVVRATEGQTDGDLDSELSDIIIDLKSFVESILEAVVSANERSVAQRAISALSDKDRIASWARELDRRVLLINMHLSMITQRRIYQQSRQVNKPSMSTAYEDWRVVLPSVPSPFFGRDHLIARATKLLLNRRHVTLFGPGGIGKTSLAKAIIHDSVIAERFQGRRYFVSFDGLDASRISTGIVRERICRAAGLDGRLSERWEEVTEFLTGAETILVIDHADALTAARNADSVVRIIDDLASSSSVVLLLTTRSKHTAPYFVTQIVSVSTLERKFARKTFEHVCPQHIPTEIIDELSDGVDNHPLSVNIIARQAAQHEWSGAELLSAWKTNQATLLENGEGKSRSLRATVELSLNTPSVMALGDDARKLLEIIAFFPQGLNTMRVKALYPSATADADVLCAHSIIHCEGNRFTILAPVRLYLGHKAPNPDAGFLNTIRNIYYRELSGPIERRQALVEAEDVNVERLIAFDFNKAINLDDSSRACTSFLDNLAICKPRVTILTTMLRELPVRSSGILAKVTGWPARSKAVSLRKKTLLVKSAGTLASSIRRSTLTSTFLRTLFVRVNLQNSTLPIENLRTSTNPRRLRQLKTAARPFLRINRQPLSTTTPTATIKRIHSCASLPSFYSLLQEHHGVLAFFTTEICHLSRKAQPLFEEFAQDKNSNNSPVAFVQVDLNASRGAAAVGIEFGVRATPTFLFFVGGMKVRLSASFIPIGDLSYVAGI
ncbi:P-loop containing nucleoside triphosphate hydrolase protein [Suillus subaureus]|uniref:P-loop containing nucleoside triphosphate hydrolase protein n=1 Tax=Suillus subaureus TaxID=48587 RepID=A0A9P7EB24_9AGAM|nr:P-loop containing nucleoside triphosphate hydrolase protein [Suillus subaureus]KAG1816378.1 P-loop containing nucleoside triphosphate hydrolase protein [Suillus subaureus]